MVEPLLFSSKKCSSQLVAHGHHVRSQWHGAVRRQVFCAQRSRRNNCIEARVTAVRERVARTERPVPQPSQVMPLGISQAQPLLRHTEVEVHLSMQYTCTFGTRVAVIGSHQGWQTSAAAPMTWQTGDIWVALLTLPVGSDIEYKYIVIDESGSVIRWQEGFNLKLALRNPGFAMHVSDSWAQDRRQVHEIGVPAAPVAEAVPAETAEALPAEAAEVVPAVAAEAVPAEAAVPAAALPGAEALPAAAAAAAEPALTAAPAVQAAAVPAVAAEAVPAAEAATAAAPAAAAPAAAAPAAEDEAEPAAVAVPATAAEPTTAAAASAAAAAPVVPPSRSSTTSSGSNEYLSAATEPAGARRDHGSSSNSSSSTGRRSSSKLQNNIAAFSWPVVTRRTLETPASAPAAAEPLNFPKPQQQQQQQQQQQGSASSSHATDLQQSDRPTPVNTSISSAHTQQKQHPLLQQVQQQKQQAAAPADLYVGVSELLPLLQRELSSALDALSSCVSGESDFITGNLMSDGRAVLTILQSQSAAASSSSSSDSKMHDRKSDSLISVNARSSNNSALPAALTNSVTIKRSGPSSISMAAESASSSSNSSSTVVRSRRSPGSSAASSLAFEDDIAAALLSDNCEAACFCVADAISMGSEGAMAEARDVARDVLNDDTQQQQQVTVLAADANLESDNSVSEPGGPALAVHSVLVDAAVIADSADMLPAESAAAAAAESIVAAAAAVVPEEPVTAEQLASNSQWSVAATAAVARPVDPQTRAAAFAGVQRALDHSAVLLDRLSDPSHPMLLAADRELAGATQQLGQLLPA